jgi:hypothetical protein
MSSAADSTRPIGRAECAFRDSFERLKKGKPERLPKGTPVSQNNIAKEAGCDPSALKKARFPSLISEIQRWIKQQSEVAPPSPRQAALAQRHRNRSLKEQIEALKNERDHALSLLVEADTKIVELMLENLELKTKPPTSNVAHLHRK